MSFRDVDSAAAAAAYIENLNEKWPARFTVIDEIIAQIRHMGTAKPAVPMPVVLELCCGAGVLGNHLLTNMPDVTYIGIDQSEPLLEAAQETLVPVQERVTLIRADLNQDEWHQALSAEDSAIHAIVSMQSLHDLGGEAEVSRIYRLAKDLLRSGGLFINADLIVEPGEALPNNPGRLPIERHLALLTKHGYQKPVCRLNSGGFGCFVGTR